MCPSGTASLREVTLRVIRSVPSLFRLLRPTEGTGEPYRVSSLIVDCCQLLCYLFNPVETIELPFPVIIPIPTADPHPLSIFSSDAIYGIPELRLDRMMAMPKNLTPWIGRKRTAPWEHNYLWCHGNDTMVDLDMSRTVVCFYCWDRLFEQVWTKPSWFVSKLRKWKPAALVTPNFSIWAAMPTAAKIWNIYRSRWVGRFWQEHGFNIIPDVQLSTVDSRDICIAGLPRNAPCLSMQFVTATKTPEEILCIQKNLEFIIENLNPQSLFFYGEVAERILSPVIPSSLPYSSCTSAIFKRRQSYTKIRQ